MSRFRSVQRWNLDSSALVCNPKSGLKRVATGIPGPYPGTNPNTQQAGSIVVLGPAPELGGTHLGVDRTAPEKNNNKIRCCPMIFFTVPPPAPLARNLLQRPQQCWTSTTRQRTLLAAEWAIPLNTIAEPPTRGTTARVRMHHCRPGSSRDNHGRTPDPGRNTMTMMLQLRSSISTRAPDPSACNTPRRARRVHRARPDLSSN